MEMDKKGIICNQVTDGTTCGAFIPPAAKFCDECGNVVEKVQTMKCPGYDDTGALCGAILSRGKKFCSNCGLKITEELWKKSKIDTPKVFKCWKCETMMGESEQFCSECGAKTERTPMDASSSANTTKPSYLTVDVLEKDGIQEDTAKTQTFSDEGTGESKNVDRNEQGSAYAIVGTYKTEVTLHVDPSVEGNPQGSESESMETQLSKGDGRMSKSQSQQYCQGAYDNRMGDPAILYMSGQTEYPSINPDKTGQLATSNLDNRKKDRNGNAEQRKVKEKTFDKSHPENKDSHNKPRIETDIQKDKATGSLQEEDQSISLDISEQGKTHKTLFDKTNAEKEQHTNAEAHTNKTCVETTVQKTAEVQEKDGKGEMAKSEECGMLEMNVGESNPFLKAIEKQKITGNIQEGQFGGQEMNEQVSAHNQHNEVVSLTNTGQSLCKKSERNHHGQDKPVFGECQNLVPTNKGTPATHSSNRSYADVVEKKESVKSGHAPSQAPPSDTQKNQACGYSNDENTPVSSTPSATSRQFYFHEAVGKCLLLLTICCVHKYIKRKTGTARVTVYSSNGRSVGHATLKCGDKCYLSWWPKKGRAKWRLLTALRSNARLIDSPDEDDRILAKNMKMEFDVPIVDINALKKFVEENKRGIYRVLGNNCCDMVIKTLNAGGFTGVEIKRGRLSTPKRLARQLSYCKITPVNEVEIKAQVAELRRLLAGIESSRPVTVTSSENPTNAPADLDENDNGEGDRIKAVKRS